ncbi:hypothetical protein GCM10011386_38690 [Parapedobacter defluvii]|uniref:Uncharacterized protein n=1 Tax=Parapedobacter defluvii TaxID=2045106 RepID=A0ABQ1MLW2_9SPHI|nr:hypothetical protein GCM10011386_38690 [Parapedobacter defluvii]
MEEAFIEHLDQLYWEGYGQKFRDMNPKAYLEQLIKFMKTYKALDNEVCNPLSDGTGAGAVRTRKRKRNPNRSGTGDLFNQ